MERNVLRQIMIDSKAYARDITPLKRNIFLDENVRYIFTGIRQCGKSWEMIDLMHRYAEKDGWDHILYVNFETERNVEMGAADLNTFLELHTEMTGVTKPYCFFDEIQNIEGWAQFLRRLADQKFFVCVTGSNSKVLSRDYSTVLGGRYYPQLLFPFSFREALQVYGYEGETDPDRMSTAEKGLVKKYLREYFYKGGFPEFIGSPIQLNQVQNLYRTLYIGDIAARNRISNMQGLRLTYLKIAECIGDQVSYKRIADVVTAAGCTIRNETVMNYIDAARDSYLIFTIRNMNGAMVEREGRPKHYFIDNGILHALLPVQSDGQYFENQIALLLFEKYHTCDDPITTEFWYYHNGIEVDFYVPAKKMAVQACYTLNPGTDKYEGTVKREAGDLVTFSSRYECEKKYVITYEKEELPEEYTSQGIETLTLLDVMLKDIL